MAEARENRELNGQAGGSESELDPRAAKLRLMCVKEREHPVCAPLVTYLLPS